MVRMLLVVEHLIRATPICRGEGLVPVGEDVGVRVLTRVLKYSVSSENKVQCCGIPHRGDFVEFSLDGETEVVQV